MMMVLSFVVPDSVAPPGLVMFVMFHDLGLPPQAVFGRRSAAEWRRRFAVGLRCRFAGVGMLR